jgi:hypothetical protein
VTTATAIAGDRNNRRATEAGQQRRGQRAGRAVPSRDKFD